MTEEQRLAKNKQIKETRELTEAKRLNQVCKIFQLKIDFDKLSKQKQTFLKMLFVEAKWIQNHVLAWGKQEDNNICKFYHSSLKEVQHFDKDKQIITSPIKYITSSMKMMVIKQLQWDVASLAGRKQHGHKIGHIKFKKQVNCIDLPQYGLSHKIISSRQFHIQGFKNMRVFGLKQIPATVEFANAKLIQKPSGYYIYLTTYQNKEDVEIKASLPEIGIDMGIKTHITTSDGEKINVKIEETDRLKKLSRQLNCKQKGSNNRYKCIQKIKLEYEKISNRKNEAANKIVHQLLKHQIVYMQDELLNEWKKTKGMGKAIQHSILGRVKQKLKNHPDQVIIVASNIPTTKTCPSCWAKVNLTLSDRTFKCSCGYQEDRDIHAAKNMIRFGKLIGREPTKFKPVDQDLKSINLDLGMKQETQLSLAAG